MTVLWPWSSFRTFESPPCVSSSGPETIQRATQLRRRHCDADRPQPTPDERQIWNHSLRIRDHEDFVEQNPEVPFVKDLRNFTLHRELPGLGHTVQFADLNSSDASMSSEVDLSVEQLWLGPSGSPLHVRSLSATKTRSL